MKKITAYKANDGQIFEDEQKAIDHDKQVQLIKEMNEFTDHHFYRDMSASDIAETLIQHKEELLKILQK